MKAASLRANRGRDEERDAGRECDAMSLVHDENLLRTIVRQAFGQKKQLWPVGTAIGPGISESMFAVSLPSVYVNLNRSRQTPPS